MTTLGPRAMEASSFSVIKGSLILETYELFAAWEFEASPPENMRRARDTGALSHGTISWAHDTSKAIRRRFAPEGRDRRFVQVTQTRPSLPIWQPLLLWHMTRDEFLVRDFLTNWLYLAYEDGVFRLDATAAETYVASLQERSDLVLAGAWTDTTKKRVASGLMRTAADFGLLKGRVSREFTHFHLPDESFLYIVAAMLAAGISAREIVASNDWRLFLMSPTDVDRELLRFHQLHQVRYETAGSIARIELRDWSVTALARGAAS